MSMVFLGGSIFQSIDDAFKSTRVYLYDSVKSFFTSDNAVVEEVVSNCSSDYNIDANKTLEENDGQFNIQEHELMISFPHVFQIYGHIDYHMV